MKGYLFSEGYLLTAFYGISKKKFLKIGQQKKIKLTLRICLSIHFVAAAARTLLLLFSWGDNAHSTTPDLGVLLFCNRQMIKRILGSAAHSDDIYSWNRNRGGRFDRDLNSTACLFR